MIEGDQILYLTVGADWKYVGINLVQFLSQKPHMSKKNWNMVHNVTLK